MTNTYPVGTTASRRRWATATPSTRPSGRPKLSDCAGSLAAGDEKTCTITNKRKPKLTVVKRIIGGDGSSFDISVGGRR